MNLGNDNTINNILSLKSLPSSYYLEFFKKKLPSVFIGNIFSYITQGISKWEGLPVVMSYKLSVNKNYKADAMPFVSP